METTKQKAEVSSDTNQQKQISGMTPKRPRGRPRKVTAAAPVAEQAKVPAPKQPEEHSVQEASVPNEEMLPLTLGMALQQARLARHLKLSSISKKLRIKEVYLDALEKGRYHDFPALVYGIGFLRTYAVFLGLDAEELVARFHRETTDIPNEPLTMPHNADPKLIPSVKTAVKAGIAALLLYPIWNVYKTMTESPAPEPNMPVVVREVTEPLDETVVAPVTADELFVSEKPVKQEETEPKPLSSPAPKRTPVVYGLKQAARVSLVATDTVWIQIRDVEADRVMLEKTLEIGDKFNPDEDAEGLVLKTTNAGGLDVYIDGKKKKSLGNKGQTKAGIPLDANGLAGK